MFLFNKGLVVPIMNCGLRVVSKQLVCLVGLLLSDVCVWPSLDAPGRVNFPRRRVVVSNQLAVYL